MTEDAAATTTTTTFEEALSGARAVVAFLTERGENDYSWNLEYKCHADHEQCDVCLRSRAEAYRIKWEIAELKGAYRRESFGDPTLLKETFWTKDYPKDRIAADSKADLVAWRDKVAALGIDGVHGVVAAIWSKRETAHFEFGIANKAIEKPPIGWSLSDMLGV